MKKIFFLALFFALYLKVHAQWTDNDSYLTTSDNVGIGVSTALNYKLTVNGGIDIIGNGSDDVGLLLFRPNESNTEYRRWFLRADLTKNESYPYLTNRTPSGKVVIKTGTASGGSENTHFTLEGGDGTVNAYFEEVNLGIGTDLSSNPNNYKLAVNGTIGAKEVKVELTSATWSDFVFNDNYQLMPIKDVENFIKEKNHLPNIPTANEVEKNGVNLGEMDAKLLQKIEELTLYMIAQDKRIEKLEKENETLKTKLDITQ